MTQPLAAVYKTRNTETGQAKYGHVWLKNELEALTQVKAKGVIDKNEELASVWSVEWRDPESEYRLMFGDAAELFPVIDVAAQLRERFLKKRMGKKERRTIIADVLKKKQCKPNDRSDWWKCQTCSTTPNNYKYTDLGMEPLIPPEGAWKNPWYTISRAPIKEKA